MTPPDQSQRASGTGEDAAPSVGHPNDMELWLTRSLLDCAVEYATRGWAVLPLAGKVPRNRRGVTDATTDLDVIRAWWTRWPDANIGARVPSGYAVFDIDPRNGGSDAALFDGVKPTLTLTVLSGRRDRGLHLYYLRPDMALSAGRLPVGIDLKVSGYMVMPPSVHPETGYPYNWYHCPVEPMPEHLLILLRPPLRLAVAGERFSEQSRSRRAILAQLQRLMTFVADAVQGERNTRLFWAACRIGEMLAAGELPDARRAADALATVGLDVGLEPGEVGNTIASGFKSSGVIV